MNVRQQMRFLGAVGLLALGAACGGVEESSSRDTSGLAQGDTGNVEQAAAWCECTNYVNNRFNLGGGFPNAQDWGPYLTGRGYYQVSSPAVGDIVVYTAARMGNCCGHVGVIAGVGSTSLTVRGANQIWSTFTEYNCTNVSQGNFNRRTDGTERYYRR